MVNLILRSLLTGWPEREQSITIDVAYRYFTTDRRNFIVDTQAMNNIPAIWQLALDRWLAIIMITRARGARPN